MVNPIKRILIMAGGTGGHILPALAVAKALQSAQIEVHWLGTRRGLEQQLIPPTGIPLHYIQVQGIRGKGILGLLAAPFRIARATWQAAQIIFKLRPAAVIGFGGFVSGPGGLASWLFRKPLLIHEQNAVAGLTNRWLTHLATAVFQAFPHTFTSSTQAITCGNPVRAEILTLALPAQRFIERRNSSGWRVLIVGGSQGATILNQRIPQILAQLSVEQRPQIWHSAGKSNAEKTLAVYQKLAMQARVVEFIQDMAAAYAWADLVICRAGALTVAELAAAGVASILIPYPLAVDDHQTKNAAWLVDVGAAILIPQSTLADSILPSLLVELAEDKNRLLTMGQAAQQLAIDDATSTIVSACLSTVA